MTSAPAIHVAIIGGGIAGVTLALGLDRRGVSYTLYERAPQIREIGAGIGVSPNAERAMKLLDPRVHAAFKAVATPNGDDHFQWIDGYATDQVIYKLYMEKDGFQGCRRSDLVEEMLKAVPGDQVQLGKQAEAIRYLEEDGDAGGGGVEITFADGTTARADVVIGCDGIRSRVRELLLGGDNPASRAGYTGKFCFRALVPLDRATAALGRERTRTRFMYNGPGAHAITYPVGTGADTVLNTLVVVSDPNLWPLDRTAGRHTAPGDRREAQAAVEGWHPRMRALVGLLPEKPEKWAIFDSMAHPADAFARGQVCLAGDAAHATGPHLGAGGGMGIEDALVLSALLEAVAREAALLSSPSGNGDLVRRSLGVYNDLRIQRTQWVVRHSREAVALFQWQDPEGHGRDWDRFGEEITWRFRRIWDYDVEGMVKEALDKLASPT